MRTPERPTQPPHVAPVDMLNIDDRDHRADDYQHEARMKPLMKLCRDCKHFDAQNRGCVSPLNFEPEALDYINGDEGQRERIRFGAQACRETPRGCGPSARWFEPKIHPLDAELADRANP